MGDVMRGDRGRVRERIVNTAVGVSGLVSGTLAKGLANKATEGLTPPTYNGGVPKCWEEKGKETIKKAFDDEREPVGVPHAAGLKKEWGAA
ncbi:hypothetical protein [Methanopyrus kandleri]|uniref:Uncharacterized protein n=1 Tax=Methanopyrus kandleri TaxID=2320 RepID=A0A832T1A0_9EURY|nr:hypothetical protein [Methanopyrus kandleri]HII69780.1 hypothetical protein [Methanopyrus kandleri]